MSPRSVAGRRGSKMSSRRNLLFLLCLCLPVSAMAQGRLPQRRSARVGPAQLKLLKQPTGELSGSIAINTVDSLTQKSILIPANPGTLHLELTWKGEYPLMISLTGPAGHNLPGRVGILAHDGTSPLRLEHHL